MGVLHDHPLLGAEEINGALPESDLDQQVERVRITPQPMSVEEMSKLWTTFQTQYRMSAAYQASRRADREQPADPPRAARAASRRRRATSAC